eukprot:157239-Pyramimonas_sp.AAC.1
MSSLGARESQPQGEPLWWKADTPRCEVADGRSGIPWRGVDLGMFRWCPPSACVVRHQQRRRTARREDPE